MTFVYQAVMWAGICPLWLWCFALMSRDLYYATPYSYLDIRTAPLTFPIVTRAPVTIETGVHAGDVLLEWGGESLYGATDDSFTLTVASRTPPKHIAQVTLQRDGETHTLDVPTGSMRSFWPRALATLVFFGVGLILQLRGPPTNMTRSFVAMLLGGALGFVCTFTATGYLVHVRYAVLVTGVTMFTGFAVQSFLLFPDGEPPRSRWLRWLPAVLALGGPMDFLQESQLWIPSSITRPAFLILTVAMNLSLCAIVAWRYHGASATDRRMLKWILWGVYLAVFFPTVTAIMFFLEMPLGRLFYISIAALAFIPIALLIAVLRYNIFDINRLITLTAFGSILIAVLLVAAGVGLPQVATLAGAALGLPPVLAQTLSTITLVMLVFSTHKALSPWITRKFFPERWALESVTPRLLLQLQAAKNTSELFETLVQSLRRTVQPVALAAYCRVQQHWELVAGFGQAIAPVLKPDCEILARLRAQPSALLSEAGAAETIVLSQPYDMSLAAGFGLSLTLPLTHSNSLCGVLMLGRKASGDIYVASEVALLTAFAQMVSERLSRFEAEAMMQQTREMHDKLCRYVPGAIATALGEGHAIDPGEREVTLMFVDIRGYSGFAEGRDVREVFSTLNEYTGELSAIVRSYGGNIVEFNGDGMMTVFGAPQVLPHKEEAAVRAALAIHAIMPMVGEHSRSLPLQVGIGIATGAAYVGSISAVDRSIWTAVGETTNRAARLQTLTRELRAAVLVDERTWRRAREVCIGFVHHKRLKLRGMRVQQDVFAKPLEGQALDILRPNIQVAAS